MKRSNLIVGIVYFLIGAACLAAAKLTETRLESLLWGFSGAGLCSGTVVICRYFYWNAPSNREEYAERLENERIELHDELKQHLRDRAGRYAYLMGLCVSSVSIMVFAVLGMLELVPEGKILMLYAGGYMIMQLVAGWVFFRKLLEKYQ